LDNVISSNKWFWARSDHDTKELALVYVAQIMQPKYYHHKEKKKVVCKNYLI